MESLDLSVLANAVSWRRAGHGVTLVTVVQTWGSAPRPPGSLLAIRGDGMISGSVSGGCVEDDLIVRIRSGECSHRPVLISYGVTQSEAARFGLPCGGTLRLVQEPLTDIHWVEELLQRCEQHRLVSRTLTLETGLVELSDASRVDGMHFNGLTLTAVFGPQWRLLLIGAGQLSLTVASIAKMLDFEVLICDPRDEYASSAMNGAITRVPGMPDDAVRELCPDAHTAIVALTHDPKLDDMALIEALKSHAFYVGALGSARNQAARKHRLSEHFDLSAEELARLHGPVGLRIAANTPAEIAVSIIAQIIQVKNSKLVVANGALAPAASG